MITNEYTLKWVAAQLKPNMLSKVELNLERQSFEYFAPKRSETVRSGQFFKNIKKLIFPGYVFIRIDPESSDVRKVNSTIGISRLVKLSNQKVGIIPDSFVDNLKVVLNEYRNNIPDNIFPGKKVRWIDGPFTGIIGEIINLDENGRLKILFKILDGYRVVTGKANNIELA